MKRELTLTANDHRELTEFIRYLQIIHWRRTELGETQREADRQAAIAVYGDEYAEGVPKP